MVSLKELLKNIIPQNLHHLIPTSFDIIGSRNGAVAIIEIPEELELYKYEIAKALIKINKHVKTVLRKISGRKGIYRLYNFEILIPGPTEVLHKEHGYFIKVDPTKVYFSPRDHSDRLDIAKQVKPNEFIIYMFAGVGPYAICICKQCPDVRQIIAIEINSIAIKYMMDNIRLNKLKGKITPIEGDVICVSPKYYNTADRVIMTLPLGAFQYLEYGIKCIRNGILHFYHIGPEENPFKEAENIIISTCEKLKRNCRIINRKIVRDYAPRMYKIRVDAEIW